MILRMRGAGLGTQIISIWRENKNETLEEIGKQLARLTFASDLSHDISIRLATGLLLQFGYGEQTSTA